VKRLFLLQIRWTAAEWFRWASCRLRKSADVLGLRCTEALLEGRAAGAIRFRRPRAWAMLGRGARPVAERAASYAADPPGRWPSARSAEDASMFCAWPKEKIAPLASPWNYIKHPRSCRPTGGAVASCSTAFAACRAEQA